MRSVDSSEALWHRTMKTCIATLMCVYRGDSAELFSLALQSVLSQVLDSDIESRVYVGVDGPVPQAIEDVICAHRDKLFKVLRSSENQGLARTLNCIIEALADEEFVFRMDADDESMPERYNLQLSYLARHPHVDILGTAITEIDSATGEERIVTFSEGPLDAVRNIHRRVPVAHPTVCMRRRVLDEMGGYPVVGTNEDVAMWFACIQRGLKFDNLPQTLLRFRISESFWRRRSVDKAWSEFLCYLRGIRTLDGLFTLKYAFPVLRLLVRLAPTSVSRWAYRSSFRHAGARG